MIEHLFSMLGIPVKPKALPERHHPSNHINIKVVGVGGAGGNAVSRMAKGRLQGLDILAINTDVQALRHFSCIQTLAIGPNTTKGMGSGGHPEIGRKAIKESIDQVTDLLKDSDMVFVTAGMGGGTGTGAAATVAEIARKQGALTVGVVTLPFSFEGPRRRAVAEQGIHNLKQKVDTLIIVENDRLHPSLNGSVTLQRAFEAADEVLTQGVRGISEVITMRGMINVDFADVKSIMSGGGQAFMAVGEGSGKWAAMEAAERALANPLFDKPLNGASGILFNVKGGNDLTLGQVHEVADLMRKSARSDANVIFGVAQERSMKRKVSITLIATGVEGNSGEGVSLSDEDLAALLKNSSTNGHAPLESSGTRRLL